MEVDEAAVLEVSHPAVRDPTLLAELSLAHSQVFGQLGDGGGGAMPQLARQSVPDDCRGVVITARSHDLAEQRDRPHYVAGRSRLQGDSGAPSYQGRPHDGGRAIARGGKGGEHAGLLDHGVGDVLVAGQAGPDEVASVAPTRLGTRQAAGGPPVAAGDKQLSVGFVGSAVAAEGLAAGLVDEA